MRVVKKQRAIDRIYEWTILDDKEVPDYADVDMMLACINCKLQGQTKWQNSKTLQLYFYCPACDTKWTIFHKGVTKRMRTLRTGIVISLDREIKDSIRGYLKDEMIEYIDWVNLTAEIHETINQHIRYCIGIITPILVEKILE